MVNIFYTPPFGFLRPIVSVSYAPPFGFPIPQCCDFLCPTVSIFYAPPFLFPVFHSIIFQVIILQFRLVLILFTQIPVVVLWSVFRIDQTCIIGFFLQIDYQISKLQILKNLLEL